MMQKEDHDNVNNALKKCTRLLSAQVPLLLLSTGLPGSQRPCLVQNATAFVTVAFDRLNDFFELVGDVLS